MNDINTIKSVFSAYNIEKIGFTHMDMLPPLIECRSKSKLPQNGKWVIGCLFPYYTGEYPQRNISKYAVGTDYHIITKKILSAIEKDLKDAFPAFQFVSFSDSSPIKEVKAAYQCGLGIIGENKQLINNKYGSYVFIGTVITDMEIPLSEPLDGNCLKCGMCIKSCPTKALGVQFNKEICRSQITQKKGELTDFEYIEIKNGGMIWGCDICSDCCPMNINKSLSPLIQMYENICPIVNMDNIDICVETKAIGYKGRGIIERNINIVYGK